MDSVSRDRTLEIARAYSEKDHRIRVISEPDKGIYDAMNKGVATARGEWVLFLGSDDRLYDQQVLSVFSAVPGLTDLDFVYGNVVSPSYKGVYDGEFTWEKLLSRNMPHQAIFYRKGLFGLLGGFAIHYKGYADWDFNIRCFSDSRIRMKYIGEVIAYFGADGVSSRHDVPFLREIMIPQKLRLVRNNPRILRRLQVFDEWWRLLRNAGIRDANALRLYAGEIPIPRAVSRMLSWQIRVTVKLLRAGVVSKCMMFINYICNFLTASL